MSAALAGGSSAPTMISQMQGGSGVIAAAGTDGATSAAPVPNALPKVAGTARAAECRSSAKPSGEMCGSIYCGVTEAQLEAEAEPTRACTDLQFMCAGTLTDVLSNCARDIAIRSGSTNFEALRPMILNCALADPQVKAHASSNCASCFLDSLVCSAKACLLQCATDSVACDECADRAGCSNSLFTCTGLPSPL